MKFNLFLFISLLTVTTSAHATGFTDFCQKFPRTCETHASQKPLLEFFVNYLDAYAEEYFPKPNAIPLYAALGDQEVETWVDHVLSIAEVENDPELALDEIGQWYAVQFRKIYSQYADKNPGDALVIGVKTSRIQSIMRENAWLDLSEWDTLSRYIFKAARNQDRSYTFEFITQETAALPGTLNKVLPLLNKMSSLPSWKNFFTNLSANDWSTLLRETHQIENAEKLKTLWDTAYHRFVARALRKSNAWSAYDLYKNHYYAQSIREIYWAKESEKNYFIGRKAKAIFNSKVGGRIQVEGTIKSCGRGKIEITDRGHTYQFNDPNDQEVYFFAQEDDPAAGSFAEYSSLLFDFYKNGDGRACNLILIE